MCTNQRSMCLEKPIVLLNPEYALLRSGHCLGCLFLGHVFEDMLWVALQARGLIVLALVFLLRVVDLWYSMSERVSTHDGACGSVILRGCGGGLRKRSCSEDTRWISPCRCQAELGCLAVVCRSGVLGPETDVLRWEQTCWELCYC